MLILTRKVGEQIRIGPDIVLTVVEVRGGKVRLGIEAPTNISILRSELQVRKDEFAEVHRKQPVSG